ncbi:hypothetical protein NPIL_463291 [Nephila pilipes]|uniref:Uncharacterized protein n=1 Tax=Nephila pilipes TaxID=299642 RepID=A0A8X6TMH6_NEPPI|nr:hypothetical protein NPIL_463291 [Nephila pilipes]
MYINSQYSNECGRSHMVPGGHGKKWKNVKLKTKEKQKKVSSREVGREGRKTKANWKLLLGAINFACENVRISDAMKRYINNSPSLNTIGYIAERSNIRALLKSISYQTLGIMGALNYLLPE